jgi:hypothetical protein
MCCSILTNVEEIVKKVRLSLKRGSKPLSFTLYDSAESAFYLKDEPPYPDGFEEDYRRVVTLKPGEILEVEWIGSEWVFADDLEDFLYKPLLFNNNAYDKYDKVRVGKISPLKGSEQKLGYLEVYAGWILGGHVPWESQVHQNGLKITEVKGRIQSKFDFPKLFSDPSMGLLQQQEEEQPLSEILN